MTQTQNNNSIQSNSVNDILILNGKDKNELNVKKSIKMKVEFNKWKKRMKKKKDTPENE